MPSYYWLPSDLIACIDADADFVPDDGHVTEAVDMCEWWTCWHRLMASDGHEMYGLVLLLTCTLPRGHAVSPWDAQRMFLPGGCMVMTPVLWHALRQSYVAVASCVSASVLRRRNLFLI